MVERSAFVVPVIARLVVVAFVPVAFTKVKFCSVVDPVSTRFVAVTKPVFEIEKSVLVAKELVDEAIAKSVGFAYIALVELAAKMENVA